MLQNDTESERYFVAFFRDDFHDDFQDDFHVASSGQTKNKKIKSKRTPREETEPVHRQRL